MKKFFVSAKLLWSFFKSLGLLESACVSVVCVFVWAQKKKCNINVKVRICCVCVFVWKCGGAVFKYQREVAAAKGRRRNDWCRRQTLSTTMFPLWVCRLSNASLWSWRQEIRKCRGFVTFTIFFHFDTFHFQLRYFTVLPFYPKWSWDFFFYVYNMWLMREMTVMISTWE